MERKTTARVGSAVEDVHKRDGKDVGLLGAGKIGDVGVERHTLSKWEQRLVADLLSSSLLTFSAAAALATAILTPRIALAPSFVLF